MVTTLTSREFNRDASKAKQAAEKGPVFITDRGQPAHVLLSIEAYNRLADNGPSIADVFTFPDGLDIFPDGLDIESDPPRLTGPFTRPAEFE